MENKVFILEDRGYMWMFHWIVYMLGGLRNLPGKTPIKIYFDKPFPTVNGKNYHKESLELIKSHFVFCEPTETDVKIASYGETWLCADRVHPETHRFLRTLFLSSIPEQVYDGKKYYLTRNNCGTLNPANKGVNIRTILNESEIREDLIEHGFEILQFEDYSFEEKIKIFNTASVIISPNSGGLTFSIFANEKTKIVEILPTHIAQHDHYKNICEAVNISYTRFTHVSTVGESPGLGRVWNMNIDKIKFKDFLKSI